MCRGEHMGKQFIVLPFSSSGESGSGEVARINWVKSLTQELMFHGGQSWECVLCYVFARYLLA